MEPPIRMFAMEARKAGDDAGSTCLGETEGATARVRCVPALRLAQLDALWLCETFRPMDAESDGQEGRLAAISREVVVLLKNLVGRGPTKAKTYIHDDCVFLLLREGHTRGEETMFAAGGGRAVAQGRVDMSETIRAPLIEVIERHTTRKVVGFMSSSQQDPDLISFIFVLDTSPLLKAAEIEAEESD